MKPILILCSLLLLAGCGGGGGGGDESPSAPLLGAMNGNMNVTAVEVLTQNPTSTASISFRVGATFTGTVKPDAPSFDIPLVMWRVDDTSMSPDAATHGSLAFALSTGTAASGVWTGSGTVTMPRQPAGDHVFGAATMPDKVFDYVGSWTSGVTAIVSIAP